MGSTYESAQELREGLDKCAGNLADLTDAVLTLAIIIAMGGGLQDATTARREVLDLFNGMREEE